MARFTAELKEGVVSGNIDQMHGCCGVAVLYHLAFRPVRTSDTLDNLYKAFHKWLLDKSFSESGNDHFGRAVYCMTDHSRGKLGEFCESQKWESSPSIFNHRSRHRIKLYWLDRKQRKIDLVRASRSKENDRGATGVEGTPINALREAQGGSREDIPGGARAVSRRPRRLVRRAFRED